MLQWLRKLFGRTTDADLMDAIDQVLESNDEVIEAFDARISELEAKQTAFQADIWEFVEGKLSPLNKRIASRLKRTEAIDREQSQALNTPESKKKAIISLAEAMERKRHGSVE